MGLDSDVPVQLPIKDDMSVTRTWCSNSSQQPCAIIEVVNPDGDKQLWSVGKNEQGLLGQGGKIKETKIFNPLAYNCKTT